ncbi:MAG: alpha/beta fold hydrolase [Candidatus Omnitrophota bacterium]
MEDAIKKFRTNDNLELFYRSWKADKDAACVVYLHGLESHMGWFSNLAVFLNNGGFNVYAFDRRGSGLNRDQRGHVYNYRNLFDDIEIFLDLVRTEHPKAKVFLAGLCLGGKIAVNFFLYYPRAVDGLVLLSPSIGNKLKFSLLAKLGILLFGLFKPQKEFKIPIEDNMFTANEKYIDFIKNDPLRLHYVSARYYLEIFRMGRDFKEATHNVSVPLLLLLAGIDDIVDVKAASSWFQQALSNDKTMKIYEGCHHIILFEERPEEIMQYIVDWIKVRIT